jgi:predicted Zn-dependent protease
VKYLRLVVAAAVVGGCATNPATGQRQLMLMSEQEEIQLGRQSDAEVRQQMGVYQDQALQQYVTRIGLRLARASHRPNLPWTFTVVDEPAVNAFALPGGFIYITRGILPFLRDEAELAAVMGHEVGHVDARHSAAAYSRQTLAGGGLAALGVFVPQTRPLQGAASVALGLAFLKNSRGAELEADQLGVGYASAAGWDPSAMPDLLSTLGRLDQAAGSSRGVPNWALTHPPAEDRVVKVQEAVAAARPAGGTATNRAELERHLDGLVFGDSREKGLVRGNEFIHPVLRFAVSFPARWELMNSDEQVTAMEKEDGNVAMVLQLAEGSGGSVQQVAQADMAKAGFRETDGQRTNINGLPAYVGTYTGAVNNVAVTVRAAHIQAGSRTYLVAGLAPSADFGRVGGAFDAAIGSFRTLSAEEASRIQPNRVDFFVARGGDTWESVARERCGGTIQPSSLAIMNGAGPDAALRAGQRIRIVTPG